MDVAVQAITDAVGLILHADADLLQIAALSLVVSVTATAIASAIGIPLGIALHIGAFTVAGRPARLSMREWRFHRWSADCW